jgi:polar amino acid transport system substrate-binding protein
VLGVKFEFINVSFDSIIPGLIAGRYDSIIGALAVTPDRLKQFNMVIYQNAGGGIVVAGGNPKGIKGVGDLCGLKVAMLKGAHFIEQLQASSDKDCVVASKPAIKMDIYNGSADTYQAVAAHRAEATYTSYDVARYTAENSHGSLGFIDQLYPDNPYGAAFTKQNLQLAKAVQAALSQIIKDGSYQKVLDKWGAGREALTSAELKQAP